MRKALDSAWPEPHKRLPPRASALDWYKPLIDEILRTDLDAPREQRHTVTRIFHRLVEEHGADVSYGMVRYYVAASTSRGAGEGRLSSGRPDVRCRRGDRVQAKAGEDRGAVG